MGVLSLASEAGCQHLHDRNAIELYKYGKLSRRVLALRGGGPAEKIAEIEAEMRKTQKNKVVGPRPLAKLVSFLHSGELSTHPPRAAGLLLLYGVPRLL